jgi:outer membrane protein assembly factor BamB
VVAVGREDGQLKWERKLSTALKFTDVDAPVVLEKDVLYVPSFDGYLYALKRKGGEVIWKVDVGGCRAVVLDDQRLFLPGNDGTVRAIQTSNGKELWKFELDSGVPTSIASNDKYLVFGSSHEYLYALDRATGQLVWRYQVGAGGGFSTSPLIDAGKQRLYVLSGGGNLMAYSFRQPPKARPHGRIDGYQFEVNP